MRKYDLIISSCLIVFFVLSSCTKEDELKNTYNGSDLNTAPIYGSVKLFDIFENEVLDFEDVMIQATDSNNSTLYIHLDSSGSFEYHEAIIGKHIFTIEKPGFAGLYSFNFQNSPGPDTIPQIWLYEEIPFSYIDFWMEYTLYQELKWGVSTDYSATDPFIVGTIMCLGSGEDVSINDAMWLRSSPGGANVNYINSLHWHSTPVSYDKFFDRGFVPGQTIYCAAYAVSPLFSNYLYYYESYFDVIAYNLNNRSNINTFTLFQ